MIYIAIGVPAGFLSGDSQQYFIVNDKLLGADAQTFQLWAYFLAGNELDAALKNFPAAQEPALRQRFEELRRGGLLVSTEGIWEYVPQRQGMGIGFDAGRGDYTVLLGDKTLRVYQEAFFLWCYCDGEKSLREIAQRLRSEDVELEDRRLLDALLLLLRLRLAHIIA